MHNIDTSPTYRPYLNRHRVVFVLHADARACDEIAGAFSSQGFMSSSAATLEALLRLVELHRPDVVIADFTVLEGEPEFIARLRALAVGVRVFLLAQSNPDAVDVVRAVRSGAISVFVKPFQLTDMLRAVSDELRQDVHFTEGPTPIAHVQGMASLTPRELEVLTHIVGGETNKEIATVLRISSRTVEVHRSAAMRKLGARNTADLVRLTLRR